jgi:Holliday junction resolvasome RuvABC endonuclease subunit
VPNKVRGIPRLQYIRFQFLSIVGPIAHEVKFSVIEGYSYGSVGRIAEIGELSGMFKLLLSDLGITFSSLAPSQLKKYITGKGKWKRKEGKEAMVRTIKDQLAITRNLPDDEADALGLALIAKDSFLGCATCNPYQERIAQLLRADVKNDS